VATLTILADENIPFAHQAFSTLGDVRLSHGRRITRDALRDVDLLIVRSITRADESLLAGTPVRFVGTATSGSDHVSAGDLARMGIAFYAALGCNARAVAEYMAVAWLAMARRLGCTLTGRRVGVIGVGHVGSLVADMVRALGMVPVLNDPPRARASGSDVFRPLDDLLDCDIITCHTPLTLDGPDSTWRLVGDAFFSRLRRGAWFCSAGRGEVVDETALRHALGAGRLGAAILDVWDHEPAIDGRLVAHVDIGTPHIAGYSLEGKMNGTAMVYNAACRFLGIEPTWNAEAAAPPPEVPRLSRDAAGRNAIDVLGDIVSTVYPIDRDHEALRRTAEMTPAERGLAFDDLRRTYPTRREFGRTSVHVTGGTPEIARTLRGLGFELS
jgi:erythronate-4-phosphate dehydrogenase